LLGLGWFGFPHELDALGDCHGAASGDVVSRARFVATMRRTLAVTDVQFPAELRRQHLYLFHCRNTRGA
jgi:hypothetical protein